MSLNGAEIQINEPVQGDSGTYQINVCSTIENHLLTSECTKFTLEIEPIEVDDPSIVVNVTAEMDDDGGPEWIANLYNQRVKVGDSLIYKP